jgi:opacity protein-like surface antigen
MRLFLRLAITAVALTIARPCAADGEAPKAPSGPGPGLHAYAAVDFEIFDASKTFDAVLGTSRLPAYGGGVDVTDIWKHVFVRVAVTHLSKKGSRVFVDGGQVFPLGIPLTVTLTPIEIGGGWRFTPKAPSPRAGRPRPAAHTRVVPYLGASALLVVFKQVSEFADASENPSNTLTGASAFGGVEVEVHKNVVVGGEAQYRIVPNALGKGGVSDVSAAYNETDLGGITFRVTVGIKFGR